MTSHGLDKASADPFARRLPWLLGTTAGLFYLAIEAAHYLGGQAHAFDFGYYLQAVALIAHGHLNPFPGIYPTHSFLSDNLALYAYPLALLYRLLPTPWLLLWAQAAWLGATFGLVAAYVWRLPIARILRYHVGMENAFAVVLVPGKGGLRTPTAHRSAWRGRRVSWLLGKGQAQATLRLQPGIWEISVTGGRGGHGTFCANAGAPYVCESYAVLTQVRTHLLVIQLLHAQTVTISVHVDAGTPLPAYLSQNVLVRTLRYSDAAG